MTTSLREQLDILIDYLTYENRTVQCIELTADQASYLRSEFSRMLQWPAELCPGRIGSYRGVELHLTADPLPRTEAAKAEQTTEQNQKL